MSNVGALAAFVPWRKHDGASWWFIRSNRRELVACGALLLIRGVWHVNPDVFDAAVVEIVSRATSRAAGVAAYDDDGAAPSLLEDVFLARSSERAAS